MLQVGFAVPSSGRRKLASASTRRCDLEPKRVPRIPQGSRLAGQTPWFVYGESRSREQDQYAASGMDHEWDAGHSESGTGQWCLSGSSGGVANQRHLLQQNDCGEDG